MVARIHFRCLVASLLVTLLGARGQAQADGPSHEAVAVALSAARQSGYNTAYLHSADMRCRMKKVVNSPIEDARPEDRVITDLYNSRYLLQNNGLELRYYNDNLAVQDASVKTVVDRRFSILGRNPARLQDGHSIQYLAAMNLCLCSASGQRLAPNPLHVGRLCGPLLQLILESKGLSIEGGDLNTHLVGYSAVDLTTAVAAKYPNYELTLTRKAEGDRQLAVLKGYATSGGTKQLVHEFHVREWDNHTCSYAAYYGAQGHKTEVHTADQFKVHDKSGISYPVKHSSQYFRPDGSPAMDLEMVFSDVVFNREVDQSEFCFKLPAGTQITNDQIRPRSDVTQDAVVGPGGVMLTLSSNFSELKEIRQLYPSSDVGDNAKRPDSYRLYYIAAGLLVMILGLITWYLCQRRLSGRAAASLMWAVISLASATGCNSQHVAKDTSGLLRADPSLVDLGNVSSHADAVPVRVKLTNDSPAVITIHSVVAGCACLPVDEHYLREIPPQGSTEVLAYLRPGGRTGRISTSVEVHSSAGTTIIPVVAHGVSDVWCDIQPVIAISDGKQAVGYFDVFTRLDASTPLSVGISPGDGVSVIETSRQTEAGITAIRFQFSVPSPFLAYHNHYRAICAVIGRPIPSVEVPIICVNPALKHALDIPSQSSNEPSRLMLGLVTRGTTITIPLRWGGGALTINDLSVSTPLPATVELRSTGLSTHPVAVMLSIPSSLPAGKGRAEVTLSVADSSRRSTTFLVHCEYIAR